jgi:hypothetical protein
LAQEDDPESRQKILNATLDNVVDMAEKDRSTLSDTLLVISFKHKQFGNKERTIEDYLVPKHIEVENRNYHN